MVARPDQEAIDLLELALSRSKRKHSVRFPHEFVRDRRSKDPEPPLAQLLRVGEMGLKVYLAVRMIATEAPHRTVAAPTDLAAMLGCPSPTTAGARRVSKALRTLTADELPMLGRVGEPGHVPTTTVLNPAGTGEEWDDSRLQPPYLTIPVDLFRRGWLIALSARAVAMLVVLKDLTGGRKESGAWVDPIRKRQYGLSNDTWTRGTQELAEAHLLDVTNKVYSFKGEPRRRNLYTLHLDRMSLIDPGEDWAPSDNVS